MLFIPRGRVSEYVSSISSLVRSFLLPAIVFRTRTGAEDQGAIINIWCYSVQRNVGTIPSAKHNRSGIPGTKQNRSGFSQTPQHVVHAPLWFLLERADLVGESSIELYMLQQCAGEHTSHSKRQAQSQRYSQDQEKPERVFTNPSTRGARTAVSFA